MDEFRGMEPQDRLRRYGPRSTAPALPSYRHGPEGGWYREVHPTHVVEHHRHSVVMTGPNAFGCGYIYGDGVPCVATFFWGGVSGSWVMRVYKLEDFKAYQAAMASLQSEHDRAMTGRKESPTRTRMAMSRDEMLGLLQPHVD